MNEFGVPLFLNGHSHADQVCRYHDDGSIAQTPGHFGRDRSKLHYVAPDGTTRTDDFSQAELGGILSNGDGTLFVDTTTTSASLPTGEYWGWRIFDLELGADRLDPETLGYPASEEFLGTHPKEPDNWFSSLGQFGMFSHPSYFLNSRRLDAGPEHVEFEIENGLNVAVDGSVLVSLETGSDLSVEGGDLLWRRRGTNQQDARVRYEVSADETLRLRVEAE